MAAAERIVCLAMLSLLLEADSSVASSATSVKFLLMVASGSNPNSSTVVSAVNLTLEEINTSILSGFHLEYILRDTKVRRESKDKMFKIKRTF